LNSIFRWLVLYLVAPIKSKFVVNPICWTIMKLWTSATATLQSDVDDDHRCAHHGHTLWILHCSSQRQTAEEKSNRVLPSLHQRRRRRGEGALVRRERHPRGDPWPWLLYLHRRSWRHPSIADGSSPRSLWGQAPLSSKGSFFSHSLIWVLLLFCFGLWGFLHLSFSLSLCTIWSRFFNCSTNERVEYYRMLFWVHNCI